MTTKDDKPLLLRFSQPGGHLAAKRSTLQECARLMGVTETRAAHIAINSLWLHGCTYSLAISSDKVNQFNELTTNIIQPDLHQTESIYTHLAWLNEQFKPVLQTAQKNGSAIFSLLGDNWQQDVVVSPKSMARKLKEKMSTARRYNLMWLESPVFDFMQ